VADIVTILATIPLVLRLLFPPWQRVPRGGAEQLVAIAFQTSLLVPIAIKRAFYTAIGGIAMPN
jgi:hypothetical protein